MFHTSIARLLLSFLLLVGVSGALLGTRQAARAQVAGPSITAAADGSAYGVILVTGQNFSLRGVAILEVRDAASGALLKSVPVGVDSRGAFLYTVSIAVPKNAPLVEQVAIRATDTSQAVSADLVVDLHPPVALVQKQLTGAEQSLAAARTAVQPDVVAVMQAQQQLFAANQALAAAILKGAPADVIARLRAAVLLAQQQLAMAQQVLAVAQAVLAELQAATGALQQELSQAQAATQ
jgi:hypothetical protein